MAEQGQEPTVEVQETETEPTTETAAGSRLTPDQLEAELRRARSDAAKYRTSLRDIEGKLAEHEQAKLTETEKLQRRVAELEQQNTAWQTERQEMILRTAVTGAATKAGAVHPDAVFKLIDLAAVNYDESGQPTNLDAVVEAARKQYPTLFAAVHGSADAGARGRPANGVDMNDWLRGKTAIR